MGRARWGSKAPTGSGRRRAGPRRRAGSGRGRARTRLDRASFSSKRGRAAGCPPPWSAAVPARRVRARRVTSGYRRRGQTRFARYQSHACERPAPNSPTRSRKISSSFSFGNSLPQRDQGALRILDRPRPQSGRRHLDGPPGASPPRGGRGHGGQHESVALQPLKRGTNLACGPFLPPRLRASLRGITPGANSGSSPGRRPNRGRPAPSSGGTLVATRLRQPAASQDTTCDSLHQAPLPRGERGRGRRPRDPPRVRADQRSDRPDHRRGAAARPPPRPRGWSWSRPTPRASGTWTTASTPS